jgi:hypothetical protein
MLMADWAATAVVLLGCLILLTTLLDILTTAFHPAAQSALTAYVNRSIYYLIEHFSRYLAPRGRRWLFSWTLPVTVAGLLIFWLSALLVGFALIYAPSMGRHGAFNSASGRLTWTDAFYYSGLCLTSIGLGDIVPREGFLRAATVGEGLCGLLVVGVTVTYLLAVFPVLPMMRVLATTLNEETDGQVGAVPMVLRYLAADSAEALAARCRELATQLMILAEAHSTHPVLFYAHPKRAEQSFLRVLAVTQRLILLLRYGVRHAEFRTLVRDPRVVGLEESYITVLHQLGNSLHLQVQARLADDTEGKLNEEYAEMLAILQSAGLRGEDHPTARERRAYSRFRLITDPYIAAYWANTGYSEIELFGDHVPLRGPTASLLEDEFEE